MKAIHTTLSYNRTVSALIRRLPQGWYKHMWWAWYLLTYLQVPHDKLES